MGCWTLQKRDPKDPKIWGEAPKLWDVKPQIRCFQPKRYRIGNPKDLGCQTHQILGCLTPKFKGQPINFVPYGKGILQTQILGLKPPKLWDVKPQIRCFQPKRYRIRNPKDLGCQILKILGFFTPKFRGAEPYRNGILKTQILGWNPSNYEILIICPPQNL